MSAPTTSPVRTTRARRTARVVAVGAAVLAALAVWVIADPVLGADLTVIREGVVTEIGGITVLVMATAAALLGWAFLAVLERFTAKARRIWLVTALVVLVLSFVMPFNSGEIDASAQVALLAMHVALGAVLIPLLVRTSGD